MRRERNYPIDAMNAGIGLITEDRRGNGIFGCLSVKDNVGVPVKTTLILIYMKAAAMYGLAGFMLGAKAGGASVTGGRGIVSSAIIGVAVFELLKVALQYMGVDANAQYIAIGIVIFVAISLDIRKHIARK